MSAFCNAVTAAPFEPDWSTVPVGTVFEAGVLAAGVSVLALGVFVVVALSEPVV